MSGKIVLARNIKVIDGSENVIDNDSEEVKKVNDDKESEVSENESESTNEGEKAN